MQSLPLNKGEQNISINRNMIIIIITMITDSEKFGENVAAENIPESAGISQRNRFRFSFIVTDELTGSVSTVTISPSLQDKTTTSRLWRLKGRCTKKGLTEVRTV